MHRLLSETELEARLLKYLTETLRLHAWSVDVGVFKRGKYQGTGLPKGFPDIIGYDRAGKIFFIEVKTPRGKLTSLQKDFLESMKLSGALAGVATCEADIDNILAGGLGNREKMIKYEGYFK